VISFTPFTVDSTPLLNVTWIGLELTGGSVGYPAGNCVTRGTIGAVDGVTPAFLVSSALAAASAACEAAARRALMPVGSGRYCTIVRCCGLRYLFATAWISAGVSASILGSS